MQVAAYAQTAIWPALVALRVCVSCEGWLTL